MTPAEFDSLLAPVSTDDPCGSNLEYDAAFTELERIAVGKPEQQVGSTIVAAEDPDWLDVEKKGRALLARSKDLRVATHLAKALLRTSGLAGFAQGITLIRNLLEHHWQGVHPRLDPDDQNDPTARLNVLAGLADPATLNGFRTAPLISSRAAGRFSLRDVELAAGEVAAPADGAATPSASMIEGAAGDTDLGVLGETSAALATAAQALAAIEGTVADKVGGGDSADFGRLPAMLRKAHGVVVGWISLRAPVAAAGELAAPPAGSAPRSSGGTGEISSREDVIRALDRIIAYYSRYEPSSPIPVLIERSKRLVSMSFLEIIRELVPDGVSQIEVLRGRTD